MVDRKRRSAAADLSTEPTVASVLGLSGPIRFRLHGSSQKAHLVLRRVPVSDDSTDDEAAVSGPPTTAFYSLFAQKRIEVKPGKEILLAIEGEFSDRPVLIGGNLPASQRNPESPVAPILTTKGPHIHDVLPDVKDSVTEKQLNAKPQPEVVMITDSEEKERDMLLTVPPKMRKSWIKGRQSLPDSQPRDILIHSVTPTKEEMGVQAQPDYTSVFVETTSIPGLSCGVQTRAESPVNVHHLTDKPASVLDADTEKPSQETLSPSEPMPRSTESESEDSLSPMEISSTPSTPEQESSKAPQVSLPPIQLDPILLPEEPKLAVLPPERPFSPSSSASSVQDELEIRLITDEPKKPSSPMPTVPASSFNSRLSHSPPIPSVKQLPAIPDPRDSPMVPTQASSNPAPLSAVPSSSKVTIEQTSGNRAVTDASWKIPESIGYWEAPAPTSSYYWDDPRSRPSSSHSGRLAPDMSVFRKPPDVDMYSLWGSTAPAATGTWGSPSIANILRANTSAASSDGRTQVQNRGNDRSIPSRGIGRTPPDPKSLVNIAQGPIDNPLGIRPPSTQVMPIQAPPLSLVFRVTETKKGLKIGSDWPPRKKSATPANGSSHSDQPTSESSLSISREDTQLPTSQSPHSYSQEASGESDGKWKRIDADTSSLASRKRSADSTTIKHESPTDPAVPSTSTASTGGIYANGKPLLQPPNFVGYSPPIKSTASASSSASYPPRDPGFQSEMPRGVKRLASADFDASANITSPMLPSRRILRWPTHRPVHVAQIQGSGADIRSITFNSDGSQFAVCCQDCSVRIWNNITHTEMAKLAHVAPVVSVAWMEGDSGVVTLSDTGEVSKWTRVGGNQWHWAKLLDTSSEHRPGTDPTSFAYMCDRIAIAFPRVGVKVWLWVKGMWQPQRSILRQNVTSIKFVEEGEALVGGTADGVLWYCQIPNGTLRAYSFFKSGVCLLDVNFTGSHLLVSRTGGFAHLVSVVQDDRKGKTDHEYSLKDEAPGACGHGAMFTNGGQTVIFGAVQGCLLIWDKEKVISGLDHGDDVVIQAIANFDPRRDAPEGHLITGTKSGILSWWEPPPTTTIDSSKRVRVQ